MIEFRIVEPCGQRYRNKGDHRQYVYVETHHKLRRKKDVRHYRSWNLGYNRKLHAYVMPVSVYRRYLH